MSGIVRVDPSFRAASSTRAPALSLGSYTRAASRAPSADRSTLPTRSPSRVLARRLDRPPLSRRSFRDPAVRVEDLEDGNAAVGGQADHVTLHQQSGLGQREVSFVRQSTGRRVEAADDAGRDRVTTVSPATPIAAVPVRNRVVPKRRTAPAGKGSSADSGTIAGPSWLGLAPRRVCGRAERREAPDDQTAREDGELRRDVTLSPSRPATRDAPQAGFDRPRRFGRPTVGGRAKPPATGPGRARRPRAGRGGGAGHEVPFGPVRVAPSPPRPTARARSPRLRATSPRERTGPAATAVEPVAGRVPHRGQRGLRVMPGYRAGYPILRAGRW